MKRGRFLILVIFLMMLAGVVWSQSKPKPIAEVYTPLTITATPGPFPFIVKLDSTKDYRIKIVLKIPAKNGSHHKRLANFPKHGKGSDDDPKGLLLDLSLIVYDGDGAWHRILHVKENKDEPKESDFPASNQPFRWIDSVSGASSGSPPWNGVIKNEDSMELILRLDKSKIQLGRTIYLKALIPSVNEGNGSGIPIINT